MSTDSRYSPKTRARQVPPPKQQAAARRKSGSIWLKTLKIRRWWGSLNIEHTVPIGAYQTRDQCPLVRVEPIRVQMPPLPLIERKHIGLAHSLLVQLPGEQAQGGKASDLDGRGSHGSIVTPLRGAAIETIQRTC
jgi:hypothetical protein